MLQNIVYNYHKADLEKFLSTVPGLSITSLDSIPVHILEELVDYYYKVIVGTRHNIVDPTETIIKYMKICHSHELDKNIFCNKYYNLHNLISVALINSQFEEIFISFTPYISTSSTVEILYKSKYSNLLNRSRCKIVLGIFPQDKFEIKASFSNLDEDPDCDPSYTVYKVNSHYFIEEWNPWRQNIKCAQESLELIRETFYLRCCHRTDTNILTNMYKYFLELNKIPIEKELEYYKSMNKPNIYLDNMFKESLNVK